MNTPAAQTLLMPPRSPPQRFRAGPNRENPFVTITPDFKLGIVIYFLIWRFFPEIAQPFAATSGNFGLEVARSAMAVCVQALILWPILARRFAGTPIGWLHPLVLPSLISVPSDLIKTPAAVLEPVASLGHRAVEVHALVSGDSLLQAQVEVQFWWLLALVATYTGFALFQPRVAARMRGATQVSPGAVWAVMGLGLAAAAVLITLNGGLIEHLVALAGGRFRALSRFGMLLMPITFLPVLCALWYLYRPGILRTQAFIAVLSLSVILQFVVLGSRSGLFSAAIMLLLAWMYVNHRLPTLRLLALGLGALLLLGALGELRQSGRSGKVEFDTVTQLDISKTIETNQKETALREFYSGPIAIAARVPDRVNYRYGSTYIGGLLFFVPRSLWEDKPRGPGPTVVALIFSGKASMEDYEGKGVPAGGAGEAFFNFGYPGIIVAYLLFGMFLKWAAQLALVRRSPPVAMLLILIGTGLNGPTTTSIVPFLQKWVMLGLSNWFITRRASG